MATYFGEYLCNRHKTKPWVRTDDWRRHDDGYDKQYNRFRQGNIVERRGVKGMEVLGRKEVILTRGKVIRIVGVSERQCMGSHLLWSCATFNTKSHLLLGTIILFKSLQCLLPSNTHILVFQ